MYYPTVHAFPISRPEEEARRTGDAVQIVQEGRGAILEGILGMCARRSYTRLSLPPSQTLNAHTMRVCEENAPAIKTLGLKRVSA